MRRYVLGPNNPISISSIDDIVAALANSNTVNDVFVKTVIPFAKTHNRRYDTSARTVYLDNAEVTVLTLMLPPDLQLTEDIW